MTAIAFNPRDDAERLEEYIVHYLERRRHALSLGRSAGR
ncbi:hypothetical protein GLA29479_3726 [Lysobacter antibioticus]|nr:hypothetical protein GLA29479_3726 [Lysobacter antibioticus]